MFLKSKNQAWARLCVPAQRSSDAGPYFLVLMNKAGYSAVRNRYSETISE